MVYLDHLTEFVILKALKTKLAEKIVEQAVDGKFSKKNVTFFENSS